MAMHETDELNDVLKLTHLHPHSCAYLSIIPMKKDTQNDIIFISSDLHISQGCYEIKLFECLENNSKIALRVHVLGTRTGSIYLKLPINKKVVKYGNYYEKIDDQENIWKFHMEIENEAIIEIILS